MLNQNQEIVAGHKAKVAARKGFIVGMLVAAAVFSAPRVWNFYREAQREQLEKVKEEMRQAQLDKEFEECKAATLNAEQMSKEDKEKEALWKAGIYPENDDAYCGNCPKCKAMDAEYARRMAKEKALVR